MLNFIFDTIHNLLTLAIIGVAVWTVWRVYKHRDK